MNGASQLIHAVRGPLMLITLGVLVLIDYTGIYSFSRTWPFLLIVFGVLTLLEKVAQPQRSDRLPVPPGGGSAI